MELSGYTYKCSAGETFDSIAADIYDDEKYASELMCANPEHDRKLVFEGGEMLFLPMVDVPEDEDEDELPTTPPWKE